MIRMAYQTEKTIDTSTDMQIELSILMPCLNEAETLADCINEARAAAESIDLDFEIVIADNGSDDGSQAIAEAAGARVVAVAEKGYGNALMGGIRAAHGEFVIMGDADGSYDFGELPNFLKLLREGDELVMGCRLPACGGHIEPGAMPWKHRWIGNPVLSGIGKLFFKAPVGDFHCGLRAFRRQAILDLSLCSTGMEFASEMVVKALLADLSISETPITLRPDGRSRKPHLRSWHDGWRHLRFMLLYSPRWLFVVPGLLFLISGVLGFALLMPGPLTINTVTFDTNSLLICASFVLIGFQVLFFGLFARVYAVEQGLLPKDTNLSVWTHDATAEWGTIIGVCLLLAGLALLVWQTLLWKEAGYGGLSYSDSLRLVIPGVTLAALGIQSIFSGFMLAILNMKKR